VARWAPNPKQRLAGAALELYAERGYEHTTVVDIAERAGLTERTFFRHFADKREVLFAGAGELTELLTAAVAAAPARAAPIEVIQVAFRASGDLFDERRDFARLRNDVITSTPELQERELIKLAHLAASLAAALRDRGVEEPTATLAAEAGISAFRLAFERWVTSARGGPLADEIDASFVELRTATSR
jgi:AcrR family transcriptional regulator